MLFCVLFFLEEANWGQVFFASPGETLFENEDQTSLHTQYLRPVFVWGTMDAAELLSLFLYGAFTVAVPLAFVWPFKLRIPWYFLGVPFALLVLCYLGKWNSILIPWSCGYDAFEEIVETMLAASSLYWAHLYLRFTGPEKVTVTPREVSAN